MSNGFQRALNHIRSSAGSEFEKGRLFERLMKAYLRQDPLYRERFLTVWLWSEWAETRPDFTAKDTGVDLVAQEREGGYCAIQCKCYAPGTPDIESASGLIHLSVGSANHSPRAWWSIPETSGAQTPSIRSQA